MLNVSVHDKFLTFECERSQIILSFRSIILSPSQVFRGTDWVLKAHLRFRSFAETRNDDLILRKS